MTKNTNRTFQVGDRDYPQSTDKKFELLEEAEVYAIEQSANNEFRVWDDKGELISIARNYQLLFS